MAFEWLTGSNPQFWKNYSALFDEERPFKKRRYVVFDMEVTGSDPKEDNILSIGCIGVDESGISVGDFLYVSIFSDDNASTNSDVIMPDTETVVEAEAMIQLLNFIKDATLVGNNINADIEMINQALKRLELGRLKNDVMDTSVLFKRWKGINDDSHYTLDELCETLKIEKPSRNTSWGNAYATALVFLKLKAKISI